MMSTRAIPARPSFSPLLTAVAAMLAVALFGFYLFAVRPDPPPDLGAFAAQTTETPTPASTPTLVPIEPVTATPLPAVLAQPGLVPTVVPPDASQAYTLVTPPPGFEAAMPTVVPPETAITPIAVIPVEAAQPTVVITTGRPDVFADLSVAEDITPAQTASQSVEGTLMAEKPNALYHFVAPATGMLTMRVESSAINDLEMGMLFLDAGGSGGGGGGGGGGESADIQRQIGSSGFIQAGGNVYIHVGSASGKASGKFTLTTFIAEPIPLQFESVAENDLNQRVPAAVYSFEAEAGDVISARVEGRDGYDTQLQLSDSTMLFSLGDDDSGDGYNPELTNFALPHTGTYYLIVQPYNGPYGASGHFSLTVTRQTPLALDEGPQSVAFNSKQPSALTFEGKAGETVQVVARIPTDATAYSVQSLRIELVQNGETVTVFNRGDGRQLAARGEGGGVTLLSGPVTIPADGPVSVRVDASGFLDNADSLRLEVAIER